MILNTKGIVLHTIKYSDHSLIVKMYTRECGTTSFMIKNAFNPRSHMKASFFSPLALFDVTFDARSNRQIHYFKEINYHYSPTTILFDPSKSTIMMFYNELLYKLLFDAGPDQILFDNIEEEIELLDHESNNLAERPLRFLLKLSILLGFFPENNYSTTNCYFSLEECRFQSYCFDERYEIPAIESRYLWQLMSNADDCHAGRETRNHLLHYLIEYYKLHNEQIKDINSIEVLSEVLHE